MTPNAWLYTGMIYFIIRFTSYWTRHHRIPNFSASPAKQQWENLSRQLLFPASSRNQWVQECSSISSRAHNGRKVSKHTTHSNYSAVLARTEPSCIQPKKLAKWIKMNHIHLWSFLYIRIISISVSNPMNSRHAQRQLHPPVFGSIMSSLAMTWCLRHCFR